MADKKILEDEILSDEELDQVAGGSKQETKEITTLYVAALMKKALFNKDLNVGDSIEGFLDNAGITASMNNTLDIYVYDTMYKSATPNSYYLDGKSITHEQAVKHLKEFYGF